MVAVSVGANRSHGLVRAPRLNVNHGVTGLRYVVGSVLWKERLDAYTPYFPQPYLRRPPGRFVGPRWRFDTIHAVGVRGSPKRGQADPNRDRGSWCPTCRAQEPIIKDLLGNNKFKNMTCVPGRFR